MLKSILEFFVTGAAVVVGYVLYFVTTVILTFLLGLPIAFGIKMILDFITTIFTQTNTITY